MDNNDPKYQRKEEDNSPRKITKIISEIPGNIDDLSKQQLINKVLLTEGAVKKSLYGIGETLEKLSLDFFNHSFSFDTYASNKNFIKALERVYLLVDLCHDLYYFKNSIMDCSRFIYLFIRKKFNYNTSPGIWSLKKNLFHIYHKMTFRSEFEEIPLLKEKDLFNMNPFQRLLYCDYFNNFTYKKKYVEVVDYSEKNISKVETLINLLEKYSRADWNPDYTYDILKEIYAEIKKFTLVNQMTQKGVKTFLKQNIGLIEKALDEINKNKCGENSEIPQLKLLNQISKCVFFLAYYFNDTVIKKVLNSKKPDVKLASFFQCDNEISKMIYKNSIHILFYCGSIRAYFKKSDAAEKASLDSTDPVDIQKKKYYTKIILTSSKIAGLTLSYPDTYLIGLRRCLDKNKQFYLKCINNEFSEEEKEIINTLGTNLKDLEALFDSYFSFKVELQPFQASLMGIMENVAKVLGITELNFPGITNSNDPTKKGKEPQIKIKTLGFMKSEKQKEDQVVKEAELKKKIFMLKTPIIFSLIKSLKILINCTKNDGENQTIKQNYYDLFFKILLYFVNSSPENCIILLAEQNMCSFLNMPLSNTGQLLNFLIYIVKCIGSNNITLVSIKGLFKLIRNISDRIKRNVSYSSMLDDVLRLLSKLLKIKFLQEEHISKKIKKIMNKIYLDNPIFFEFKKMYYFSSNNEDNFDIKEAEQREKISLKKMMADNYVLNGYEIFMVVRLVKNYLKIINVLYKDTTMKKDSEYLKTILNRNEIISMLVDTTLYFPLRIEVLKFFHLAYVNMTIDLDEIKSYTQIIVNPIPSCNDNYPNFNFLYDILSRNPKNNPEQNSDIFLYELKNFRIVLQDVVNKKKIYQYIEESTIPIVFTFISQYMAIYDKATQSESFKLFRLVKCFLDIKSYLIENNSTSESINQKFHFGNLLLNLINQRDDRFTLVFRDTSSDTIEELKKDITELTSEKSVLYNLKKIHRFFEKNVEGFLKKPPSNSLAEIFTKKSEQNSEDEIAEKLDNYKKVGIICNQFTETIFYLIMKYENDKINFQDTSLNLNLDEKNAYYKTTFRAVLIKSLFRLINIPLLYTKYRRQNLWYIFRLLQYDTNGSQEDVLSLYNKDNELKDHEPIININALCNKFIGNFLSIIIYGCDPNSSSSNENYTIAYIIIKILKYLCEDHNTNFQTLFFQEIKIDDGTSTFSVFELMMCTLSKVLYLSNWDKVDFSVGEENISYYYEIFFVMIEFSIEMIQGTTKSNFESILSAKGRENESSLFYKFLSNVKGVVFNDNNDSSIVYNVRLDLLNFIVAFLEEKKTPEKLINFLGILFNPLIVFNSIVNTLKKLYIKTTGSSDVKNYKNIDFDSKKCSLFIQKYFENSEFSQCKEFEVANRMYTYVKLLTTLNNKDAKRLIDLTNEYKESQLEELSRKQAELKGTNEENVMLDQNFIQNYYAVKFFESITRIVWIQGEEKNPQMVIFTLEPTIVFLSKDTKNSFYQTVPRNNRSSKLFALMEHCDYFFMEINHNKIRETGNFFFKLLNKLNYETVESWLFVITSIINVIIFLEAFRSDAENGYHKILNIIRPIAIIHIMLNFIFLVFWIISKFPLYFLIEKEKYRMARKDQDSDISLFGYIRIILFNTLLSRKEVISFLWNIIFSVVGLSHPDYLIFFSIELLIVVNISTRLRSIVVAISMSYKQLFSILFLMLLLIYIFSCFAFFFLSRDYITNNQDNHENACGTLMYCFLTHLNFGLRTDGGIGDFYHKNSFVDEPGYFMEEFFFQLLFFTLIILIMLSVLGSSIINTVGELRDNLAADMHDMNNVCFICGGDRNALERRGENFDAHVEHVHNMWTYVDYIIGLKFVDPQETNAINSFVIEKLEEKKISWFPSFNYEEDDEDDEGGQD